MHSYCSTNNDQNCLHFAKLCVHSRVPLPTQHLEIVLSLYMTILGPPHRLLPPPSSAHHLYSSFQFFWFHVVQTSLIFCVPCTTTLESRKHSLAKSCYSYPFVPGFISCSMVSSKFIHVLTCVRMP